MQDLRLVGVHDDGEHLLLSGTGGEMFQLPINEALRLAASRPSVRTSAAALWPCLPRDIQARIRSGSTAAEVAAASGMPLEKVERYEGPVLAEREYVAQQARKVEVASPAPGHDIYRSAFGDNPATLGDMVAHRLTAHGIAAVLARVGFLAAPGRHLDGGGQIRCRAGRPRQHRRRTPCHVDVQSRPASPCRTPTAGPSSSVNWSPWTGRCPPAGFPPFLTGPSILKPTPRLRPGRAPTSRVPSSQRRTPTACWTCCAPGRGQRLGLDEDSDDALALLLTNGVPAAHPRPSEVPAGVEHPRGARGTGTGTRRGGTVRLPGRPVCASRAAGATPGPRCFPASASHPSTRMPTTIPSSFTTASARTRGKSPSSRPRCAR